MHCFKFLGRTSMMSMSAAIESLHSKFIVQGVSEPKIMKIETVANKL